MNSTVTVLAAVTKPTTGWGNPVAMLAAFAVFFAVVGMHRRYKQLQAQDSSSPTGDADTMIGANPQVNGTVGTDGTAVAVVGEKTQTAARWVATNPTQAPTEAVVKDVQSRFKVSRRTAFRALQAVRKGGVK